MQSPNESNFEASSPLRPSPKFKELTTSFKSATPE